MALSITVVTYLNEVVRNINVKVAKVWMRETVVLTDWWSQQCCISQVPFSSSCLSVQLCSFHPVSVELICLCHCVPVYSLGCSVGSLEHLHHLFLPGRRRPVQGETFSSKFSSVFLFLFLSLSTCIYQQSRFLCLYCYECSFFSKVMLAGWWGSEVWFIFLCPRTQPPTL